MEQQLLQEQKKPNKLAFQVALLFSFYILALTYVFELMGMGANNANISAGQKIISTIFTYVPFIAAILYVQITHRKELEGYITFGRAFSAGFKVAFSSSLFIAFLILLYYKVLNPTALDKLLEASSSNLGDNEEATAAFEKMSKYMVYFIMFGLTLVYAITGLIISLISAAIVKKERPMYIQEDKF